MQITFFARGRDLAGADRLDLELPDRSTVSDLRGWLADRLPTLLPLLEHSRFAINEEFVYDDRILSDGCSVALIPPVSGG
jgi:molybdopterin converting factor subunit 1